MIHKSLRGYIHTINIQIVNNHASCPNSVAKLSMQFKVSHVMNNIELKNYTAMYHAYLSP